MKYWREISQKYIDGKCSFKGLFLKDTQQYIGEAGVLSYNVEHNRAVIGYNILPRFWNLGYATEITKGLVNKLFYDLGVERVEGLTLEANIVSRRVLEKSGFRLEGILRHYAKIGSEYQNVCYYGIIRPI